MPPKDPLVYRLYEIVQNYGQAYKAVLNEKFGDGIMSAISFSTKVEKEVDDNGEWAKITLRGKWYAGGIPCSLSFGLTTFSGCHIPGFNRASNTIREIIASQDPPSRVSHVIPLLKCYLLGDVVHCMHQENPAVGVPSECLDRWRDVVPTACLVEAWAAPSTRLSPSPIPRSPLTASRHLILPRPLPLPIPCTLQLCLP